MTRQIPTMTIGPETRVITRENYIATCVELIVAFGRAMTAVQTDQPDQDVPIGSALELAASCGWDWQEDKDYLSWAKGQWPTVDESLVESFKRALAVVE